MINLEFIYNDKGYPRVKNSVNANLSNLEIKTSKERNLKNYGVALIIGYNSRAGIEKPKGNNY